MKDHFKDMHVYKRKKPKTDTSEKKFPCTSRNNLINLSNKFNEDFLVCGKFFSGSYYLKKHEMRHNKLTPSEYFYCVSWMNIKF